MAAKKGKAKSKLTPRERMLLLVLPAALVVMGYSIFFNARHMQALTRSTRDLNQAREKNRTQAIALDGPALDREITRLATEKATLQRQLDVFRGSEATAAQRIEALVQVGALLRRHGLVVIEEGPAAAGMNAPQTTVRGVAKSSPGTPAPERVWQIRFLGPWGSVQEALAEMRGFEAGCFPINLTMAEPTPGVAARDWTLRLRL